MGILEVLLAFREGRICMYWEARLTQEFVKQDILGSESSIFKILTMRESTDYVGKHKVWNLKIQEKSVQKRGWRSRRESNCGASFMSWQGQGPQSECCRLQVKDIIQDIVRQRYYSETLVNGCFVKVQFRAYCCVQALVNWVLKQSCDSMIGKK